MNKSIYIFTCIIVCTLLVGCTRERLVPVYVDRNITREIVVNNTVYVNVTKECPECNESDYPKGYVLDLIWRIEYLEKELDKDWNTSYCCQRLDNVTDDFHNITKELDDCYDFACDYNVTWCGY